MLYTKTKRKSYSFVISKKEKKIVFAPFRARTAKSLFIPNGPFSHSGSHIMSKIWSGCGDNWYVSIIIGSGYGDIGMCR